MIRYFLFFSLLGCVQAKSTAILSKSQCRAIVIHHKAGADVEYKAGIDTKGKPVVPADLPTNNNFDLGKDITIDLQIPIETYAPFFPPAPPPLPGSGNPPTRDYINESLKKSQTHIGSIRVQENGEIWINGKPVHDQLQEQLTRACRQQYRDLH